ncbi:MAG TPA: Crp/Fnr family transcriptional regulator [Candidatus Binatia bacterium]|nr:Crp/Fnr family transcriptional regulator [Candidatus Binatia bacterium]
MPDDESAAILPHLEMLDLPLGFKLYDASREIEFIYFPTRGVASIVTEMKDTPVVEIATVGPEGMVGMPVLLEGGQGAHRAFMQVAGSGARMKADAFRQLVRECPGFNRILHRYALALMSQIAQNAACNRIHSVEERLARWLLMSHDRTRSDSFGLTQEFIAQMLGVRRQTVSLAAGMLSKAGLISYVRGRIHILDRKGLQATACECYDVIVSEFARLIGTPG